MKRFILLLYGRLLFPQGVNFNRRQQPILPNREVSWRKRANLHTFQRSHLMPHNVKHAANLSLFALMDDNLELRQSRFTPNFNHGCGSGQTICNFNSLAELMNCLLISLNCNQLSIWKYYRSLHCLMLVRSKRLTMYLQVRSDLPMLTLVRL